jgi:hypothetical protein
MAAIDNLLTAKPNTKDGVEGFDLTWDKNQPSPPWLSDEALSQLYGNLTDEQKKIVDKAKEKGLEVDQETA